MVVDVDASERRHLQLVVRDPATFAALDAMPYGEITNASERIYRGDSPYGIFAPGDFRHLRRYELMRDASGQVPGVEVRRDGNDLRLRALDLARPGCEPTSLHTSPPDDVYPDACEARSYVFHGCQESP